MENIELKCRMCEKSFFVPSIYNIYANEPTCKECNVELMKDFSKMIHEREVYVNNKSVRFLVFMRTLEFFGFISIALYTGYKLGVLYEIFFILGYIFYNAMKFTAETIDSKLRIKWRNERI